MLKSSWCRKKNKVSSKYGCMQGLLWCGIQENVVKEPSICVWILKYLRFTGVQENCFNVIASGGKRGYASGEIVDTSLHLSICFFLFFWWSVFQQLRLCRDLKGKSKPRMMYPLRSVWFCIHPSNQVVTWYNAWISEDWDLFEWTLTTTEVFATNSFFTNPGQRLTFWSVHLCANQVGYRPILRKVLRRYMHYYEILVS